MKSIKQTVSIMLIALCAAFLDVHGAGYGDWLKNIGEAKRLALANNRPLLVFFKFGTDCEYCEKLWNQAANTTAFLNFAAANKLVLCVEESASVYTSVRSIYKSKCDDLSDAPFFLLFKVNAGASMTKTGVSAYSSTEVTLPPRS